MQKPLKIALGLVTLWPIFYVFLFMVFFFSAFLFGPGDAGTGAGVPPAMAVFLGLHLLTMLLVLALTVFYIVNVFRNDQVEKDKKALWAIVIFMGNAIGMPIYWYLYIWKEAALTSSQPPGQLYGADTSSWTGNVNSSREQQHEYVPPPEPPNWRE